MKTSKLLIQEAPKLADELDLQLNENINLQEIAVYSSKKYWWRCKKCGNTWLTSVKHRYQGRGCPQCARESRSISNQNKRELSEQYNLQICNPLLSKEWNNEKNGLLQPIMVSPMSHKKVWWKCEKGHEWQATISSRSNGSGCPFCSGRKPIVGINDLPTTNPELIEEWDKTRNSTIDLHSVMRNSHKKVWWVCSVCGNEWQAYISDRSRGNGCPACTFANRTSEPEQVLFYYVKKAFPNAINSFHAKWLSRSSEIDIYIPSLHLGIEYDGERWHRDPTKDIAKNKMAFEHGIQIVRFREFGCPALNDDSKSISLEPKDSSFQYLIHGIETLFNYIRDKYQVNMANQTIDLSSDLIKIYSSYEGNKRQKSLASLSPQIAATWNYERNEGLKPENIANQSNKKVWWRCSVCGYEWQATVNNRIKRGCPACSNKTVWVGHNDICTVLPEMAKDWNYEKNGDLKPEMYTVGSYEAVWWKCPICSYEWKSKIYDRKRSYDRNKGTISCPACAGKHIWKGHNDLLSQNPQLASEWCYDKNGDLRPDEITLGSTKGVWWRCSVCQNEWRTSVYNRSKNHSGCPKCMRKAAALKLGKKVECIETGVIYNSFEEAGKAVDRSGSAIKACIDGKTDTCAGFHWHQV